MSAAQAIGRSSGLAPGRKSKPRRVSTLISRPDESDLRSYFKQGGSPGGSGSTMWSALRRAWLFSGARPCVECGGILETHEGGGGFVPSKRPTKESQRKMSRRIEELLAVLDITLEEYEKRGEIPKALADQVCSACNGLGWVSAPLRSNAHGAVTARPTGSSVTLVGSHTSDHDATNVARLGRVTARLAFVFRVKPLLVDVLGCYYSTQHGIFAVFPLTPAGKTLVKRMGEKFGVPALKRLLEAKAENDELPDANRTALFETAERQALELFYDAASAWTESGETQTEAREVHDAALRLLDGAP